MSDTILRELHVKCHDALRLQEQCLVVGETFAPFYRWAKKWVKCLAVTVGGKCVIVIVVACVANVLVQLFSHLNASRWISADLYTSYYCYLYLLIQLEVRLTAQHKLTHI